MRIVGSQISLLENIPPIVYIRPRHAMTPSKLYLWHAQKALLKYEMQC